MRILLVEDDSMIGESVRKGLRHDGFSVDWVQDGRAAEIAVDNGVYDLMLLDEGRPGGSPKHPRARSPPADPDHDRA